jgi:hypothetical protein
VLRRRHATGNEYAPSTLGIFLREFTFGRANQLAAVARALVALAQRAPARYRAAGVDIDSLLRPVYGIETGRPFGTPRSPAARCRLGLSPQITS